MMSPADDDGLPVRQPPTRWNALFSPRSVLGSAWHNAASLKGKGHGHGRSTICVEKRYVNVIYCVKES